MKRRGLTRFVALVTLVSLLASNFAYADDKITANNTEETTLSEDNTTSKNDSESTTEDTTEATDDAAKTDSTSTDDYINEMLEKNYTKVSAGYTFAPYKGDRIDISAKDSFDTSSDGKLTEEIQGYTKADQVAQLEIGNVANFKINVPEDGIYILGLEYMAYDEESILNPEMSLMVNGETPFYEAKRQIFESRWEDTSTGSTDRYDNEIISVPDKVMKWSEKAIMDASYRYSTPLELELKKGENTITLNLTEGSIKIGGFYLESQETIPEYESGNVATGSNMLTAIQAERPTYRNDSSIRPTCEYDCDLDPYSTTKKTLNIIDSASFADAGQMVEYEFNVEEAGYYYYGFNYRQTDKVDFPVFMDIRIDGEIPNTELKSYAFDYSSSFKNTTLATDEEKIAIYLTKGKHTISMTISNDNLRVALEKIDVVMSEINDLALEITKVAGTKKDKYRDIKITEFIPGVEDDLQRWIDELTELNDSLSKYSDVKSIGALSSIPIAISQLESLKEDPNDIPYRITELAQSSSSVNQYLANVITSLTANKISFDRIYVYQEEAELPGKSNIFTKIWQSILRFVSSFGAQAYSVDNTSDTHLQVWVNRPRQYLEIIQQMIDNDFTKKTGIQVDLSIMPDAQKLILSNAAGEAPDVAQAIDYAQPFELAIRDALVDLTKFSDYKEVMSQFSPGLLVPSTIGDSIYSLPETFYFWVLFYREDIMNKLGIEIPDTIEDVKKILPELKNRGLDFFYPTAGTTGTRVFAMTTPLLYQYGATLYGETAGDTTISSEEAIEGFTTLTELFTIYDIQPEITSFYQHFRNGDIPIGVSDYFMYSMLINGAPEIENSWKIALVPGVEDENGVVQRQTAGAAQSSVIMKTSDSKGDIVLDNGDSMNREDAAWEYLKWWMSTETQVDFGSVLQTTYGKEYIWNTANTEAFKQLPWKSRDKEIILEQMDWITESPRIPGTYLLERELSNAYVDVVINGKNLRTSIDSAVKRINRETKRKLEEFGYIDGDGNVLKEYKVPTVDTVKDILGTTDSNN